MASAEKKLEEQLLDAGNKLLKPPPASVDDLLSLLDRVEGCLSTVEQSPSKAMLNALQPSMKALIANELLKHSDVDVKVAVASCISEITRITAPDAPYDDELMKEIFRMIVTSFENLFDMSSRSYSKRISILETVAKVRSCVVMLDLECDDLILEMFHHFLNAIRDSHPDNVFSSMETIMTLVLEESEDISSELLSCLLSSVKKENLDLLPIARRLGERVISNCAAKLKPYLMHEVQSMGNSLDDYSKIVASVCQEASEVPDHSDLNTSGQPLEAEEMVPEPACPQDVDPAMVKLPTTVVSNGTAQTENDDALVGANSPKKKPERSHRSNQSKAIVSITRDEPDSLESPKTVKPETMPDQAAKKTRGRKATSSAQSVENSDHSRNDTEKEAVGMTNSKNGPTKEADNSLSECPSTNETVIPLENEKKTELSSPTGSQNETRSISQSPSQTQPEPTRPKRGRPVSKKKASVNAKAEHPALPSEMNESLLSDQIGDGAPQSMNIKSKKESEGNSDSGKNVDAVKENEDEAMPSTHVSSKKEAEIISGSEAKPPRRSGKRLRDVVEVGSSNKQQRAKNERQKEAPIAEQGAIEDLSLKKMMSSPKASKKSSNNDQSHLKATPKTKSKKKRTPVMEETSETPHRVIHLDGSIVGSTIKVWWPDDNEFYEGLVSSFDESNGKHTIQYFDDDEEVLLLKDEKWEFVESDTAQDEDQANPSGPGSSEMPQKKKRNRKSDSSTKEAKTSTPSKRGTVTSASKSKSGSRKTVGKAKVSATITGEKSDSANVVSESKDSTPKSGGKSKEGVPKTGRKSKDDTGSKSKDTPKPGRKSKGGPPKTESKQKEETSKGSSKSKVDSPKTGKSNLNVASPKKKAGSSKGKAVDDSAKGKSSPAKAQESEVQSGKKRRRQQG
ncbi:sister chromatid cohesion protein PDS5 homolog D-like [Tasmannia lanceolata]|uniref:sister chromatid cohesion protein PDS5 homolog D-like n=1 Tax=Tasmannia lanceolata TaxID=3420 RepID=UPI004062EC72